VGGVKDIIQMNNKLFTECKNLDNDLQTLVYDNYLTFIEAADTISELNSELKGLDSDLDSLSKSIEKSNTKF
jgi:peptidoglycan hydrolase CwlO-like protein